MDEIPARLSAFLAALEARDAEGAAAQLAEYAILESAIDVEPCVGRQHVAKALSQIIDVVDELTVTHVISGDGAFAIATNIRFGTTEIDGMELVGINAEGKVASLSFHLRPMGAVVALQNQLALSTGMPMLALVEQR